MTFSPLTSTSTLTISSRFNDIGEAVFAAYIFQSFGDLNHEMLQQQQQQQQAGPDFFVA